jgi:hypothetical protein
MIKSSWRTIIQLRKAQMTSKRKMRMEKTLLLIRSQRKIKFRIFIQTKNQKTLKVKKKT